MGRCFAQIKSQVLVLVRVKVTVLCDMTLCKQLCRQNAFLNLEERRSNLLRNAGVKVPDSTASYLRIQNMLMGLTSKSRREAREKVRTTCV